MTLLFFALATASARPLSLEDALATSVHNRDLRTQQLREAQARAGVRGADAAWDPTFSASIEASGNKSSGFLAGFQTDSTSTTTAPSVGLSGALPSGTTWEVGVDLTRNDTTTVTNLGTGPTEQVRDTWTGLVDLQVGQDLLAPLRRSDGVIAARKAQEQLDQVGLTTLSTAQATLQGIAEAWWTWAAAWRTADLAEAAVEEARALGTQTRARFEEGEVLRMEVDRVTADELAADEALLDARAEVRRAADALLLQMGEDPGAPITPEGTGAIAGGEVSLEQSEARALAAHPDVLTARAVLDAAREADRDARRGSLPELTGTASVGVGSLADTSLDALTRVATDPLPRWTVGVALSFPLGARAARAERSQSSAEVSIAELALESAEHTVRADVRAAVDAVDTARRSVTLAERRLEVARSTADGELARVEEGETRLDDLIAARNDVREAASAAVDAEAERARAELRLLALEGRLGGDRGV